MAQVIARRAELLQPSLPMIADFRAGDPLRRSQLAALREHARAIEQTRSNVRRQP